MNGCEVWDQHGPCVQELYTSWNKGVKRLYYLPSTIHTQFLSAFVNRSHVKSKVLRRFYKLFKTMLHSVKTNVSFLTKVMMVDARSIIGKKIRLISNMFYVNLRYIQSSEFIDFSNTLDTKGCSTVNMIKELRGYFAWQN